MNAPPQARGQCLARELHGPCRPLRRRPRARRPSAAHALRTRRRRHADFVAVGALVAAAAIIGRKVAIRPKRQDDWAVVPNLWGLAVGPPGLMKSPALAEALHPLRRLVTDADARYEEQRL